MNISRRKFKVQVPNVAMGDIAFNLLVFFVILARAQDDSHVKWEPASSAVVEKGNRAKVSVAIDKEFKLFLNGREIGVEGLADAIESKLAGLPTGERTVLLKISRDAQALQFQKVLEAVSEAGGEIVHVLQERKETAL